MLILCPSCVSAYRISLDTMAQPPTVARCAQCRRTFPIAAVAEPALPSPGPPAAAGNDRHGVPELRQPGAIGPAVLHGLRPARLRRSIPATAGRRERSPARVVAAALVVVGLGMAGTALRHRVIEAAPAAAPWFEALGLETDRGLTLRNVQSVIAAEGDTKVLTLEGRITNDQASRVAVPDLRIVVRDGAAQSVYSWTTPPPRASLAPGEDVAFHSRLLAPPAEGHDLVVSFAEIGGDSVAASVKDRP